MPLRQVFAMKASAALWSPCLMTSPAVTERLAPPRARQSFGAQLVRMVEGSHARLCAVLVLFSLVCFLPGFCSLQPMDRDEPRYAQATKQMLETGDFVDIRFQDEARHKKPVGIYWFQSAAVAVGEALGVPEARTTIALYRIPSLLGALATVLLTYWAALAFLGRRGAFLAAAFMGASVILMVEARLAKTDAVLAACSVAAMGGLARAYLGRGGAPLSLPTLAAFWLGMAIGILVKGPLVPMFVGLAALVLSVKERSAGWLLALRLKAGGLLTLAIVLPWFVAIAIKSGGAFYSASVGHDMLGKVGTAQTYHWAPPGFYLIAFFATFWPAAILATIAIPFAWANRRDDLVAFTIAWIVPSWLVFEAVPTKLPHYVMPLYPATAILTVMAIRQGFVGPHRPGAKLAALLIPFIPTGLMVGLAGAGWSLDGVIPFVALPALLAASLISVYAWHQFTKGTVVKTAAMGLAASAALAIGVFGLAQRDLRSLKISPRLAEVARAMPCESPQVATLGYREPSLVFLVGTGLEMLESGAEAAEYLKGGTCRLVFVERRFEDDFRANLTRLAILPALSTRITGFNINSGRRLDIGAYAVSP
jgi:4-amino-4-deoxy-L-arabinose transferase-like glycosyltransferase